MCCVLRGDLTQHVVLTAQLSQHGILFNQGHKYHFSDTSAGRLTVLLEHRVDVNYYNTLAFSLL